MLLHLLVKVKNLDMLLYLLVTNICTFDFVLLDGVNVDYYS